MFPIIQQGLCKLGLHNVGEHYASASQLETYKEGGRAPAVFYNCKCCGAKVFIGDYDTITLPQNLTFK